jgi:predicted nucleic acid-binding protein
MAIQRIYWDASVFHAILSKEAGRVEKCERVIKAAEADAVQIFTSAISYTECVWIKVGGIKKLSVEKEQEVKQFFEHKFIRPMACDRSIGEEARALVWRYFDTLKLQPKDAIHVASALYAKCDVLHTYDDDDLLPLNGKLGDPPLRICHPGEENDFKLSPELSTPKGDSPAPK